MTKKQEPEAMQNPLKDPVIALTLFFWGAVISWMALFGELPAVFGYSLPPMAVMTAFMSVIIVRWVFLTIAVLDGPDSE